MDLEGFCCPLFVEHCAGGQLHAVRHPFRHCNNKKTLLKKIGICLRKNTPCYEKIYLCTYVRTTFFTYFFFSFSSFYFSLELVKPTFYYLGQFKPCKIFLFVSHLKTNKNIEYKYLLYEYVHCTVSIPFVKLVIFTY